MNNSLSQRIRIQPHTHHTNLKGPSLSEGNWHPSLHDSPESDSESLTQEIQYQLELRKRISENELLLDQSSDELENDSLDEDSLEEKSLNESEGANYGKVQFSNGNDGGKQNNNESKQQPTDRYHNLRYNPNWKSNNEGAEFSQGTRTQQVAGKIPQGSSQDSSYLPSKDALDRILEKNNQLVERQTVYSDFDTELLSPAGQPARRSSGPFRLHTKGRLSADDCQNKNNSSTYGNVFSPRSVEIRQQRAKKDFVEKNKFTLGLATQKQDSYLHLHSRKRSEVHQGQVSDVNPADERVIQNVIEFQSMPMDPEDKWFQRSHQLKDHQSKWPQANRTKLNRERSLPGNHVQHPPRRPAEPGSQHHIHRNVSAFENTPIDSNSSEMLELQQDDSSSLHSWLQTNHMVDPITSSIKTSSTANWDTHLNTFPNTNYFVNRNQKQVSMNLASPMHHLELTLHKNATGLNLSPAYISEENKKYQYSPGNRPLYNQQHFQNCYFLEPLPPDEYATGHTLLNQNISSTYNANFQESVGEHVSTQSHGKQIYTDKSPHNYATKDLWPSQSAAHKPLAGPSPTTKLIQTMEQHHKDLTQLEETYLAERQFSGLFPPVIPRVGSDSEFNTERREGSQLKISRSNSEGYLLQMEKQIHLKEKVTRKPSRPKDYMNLDVKFGGLGPDYEAVREKTEKLNKQKEYAKQVKEHNMKNVATVQKPPAKSQIKSSLSRHKALEYAKKIPKPKTFSAKQSDEEPKEESTLAHTLKGQNLPQISSLKTLQNRHEIEKQAVAAFKTLHIL